MSDLTIFGLCIPIVIVMIIGLLLGEIHKFMAISMPIRLLIATILSIFVLIISFILSSGDVPFFNLISIFPALFLFSFLSILFLINSKGPSNATLTCRNGHTSRVWVDPKPYGFVRSYTQGGVVFDVGGKPVIRPEICPKCGAAWKKPHKHHKPESNPTIDDESEPYTH